MPPENLRRNTEQDSQRHADDVYSAVKGRNRVGHLEHGYTFKGDPLDHAYEELVDGLFYVEWARKKIAWLEKQLADATSLN